MLGSHNSDLSGRPSPVGIGVTTLAQPRFLQLNGGRRIWVRMIRHLINWRVSQNLKKNILPLAALHDLSRPETKRKILDILESQIQIKIAGVHGKAIAVIWSADFLNLIGVVSLLDLSAHLVKKPRLPIDSHP